MKKIICLILCLCMVLSLGAVFAACNKKPEEPPVVTGPQMSTEVSSVNLTDYSLVYPSSMSATCRQQIVDLSAFLRESFGLDVRPVVDKEKVAIQSPDMEILIGQTQRVETEQAMAEVQGHGWVIRTFANKIVVAGTTDYLTRQALNYFIDNYLTAEKVVESVLTVNQKILNSDLPMVTLVEGGAGQYSIIYSESLDDKKGSEFGTEPAGTTYDHAYDVSAKIRTTLTTLTRVSATTVPHERDSEDPVEKEILVGNVNRSESQEELAKLGPNEYAVINRGNKIVVIGWTQEALDAAFAELDMVIRDSVGTDEEGNAFIVIPADLSITASLENAFELDFPRPEIDGVSLLDTVDVDDQSMLFVYAGVGVNRSSYVNYCATLEEQGYALIAPENQVEGSSYRQYLHPLSGVTLYVSHAAYLHAEEQGVDNFTPSIRIVSANVNAVATNGFKMSLPDAELLEGRPWTKRTDPMVTMLRLKYGTGNFGLSAVITLEDGSFIVYDGGGSGKTADANDENYMYNVLVDIHKKVFGEEPTEKNPLHIRSWIITHEHWDHHTVFFNFCREYGGYKTVQIDRLLYNGASDEETYNCYNPESSTNANLWSGKIDSYIRGNTFRAIKVHSGQKFYLANAELDVLYTHEDIHPQQLEYFNNSSTIFRITLHTTNPTGEVANFADSVASQSTIWLGDLERVGSKCMRATHGDTLKADVVQVAHHGYNGVESELYDLIDPEIVLWPTDSTSWIGQTKNPNTTSWYLKVDYHVAHEMPNVKMIVISDYYNTTITFTANGPDYNNLWDALEHKVIETDRGEINGTNGRVVYRP